MPRNNRCMYIAHVCFSVCRSDCVGVCGNVCCIAAVVEDNVFFNLGALKYVCVRDVMDVVFSVCIVRRGAVDARVWEVCVFRHADVVRFCLVVVRLSVHVHFNLGLSPRDS